jgi:membrane associated rhomboid family serine protease
MGIYDRDYYKEPQRGIQIGGDRTMVTNLILINVAIYLVELFTRSEPRPGMYVSLLGDYFGLHSDLITHPWHFYQLLTYGFLHDPGDWRHIAFNMLGLFFFGREVEMRYGRKEFLSLYLLLIILSGLVWAVVEFITALGVPPTPDALVRISSLIGASGAVTGVLLLFALNFPRRTVLLMFVLPVPAWVMAILLIVLDLQGAIAREGNVAYVCHLAGAAVAFAYFRGNWQLARWLPDGGMRKWFSPRPKLRVHQPPEPDADMSQQVDDILRKIQEHGQDSLSSKERRILQDASRRYQKKRR